MTRACASPLLCHPPVLAVAGLAWWTACTPTPADKIDGEGVPDATTEASEEPACTVDGPARSPMRRLTPLELDRTLADLLDITDAPASRLLPPEQIGGFSNNVDVRTVGADTTDAYSRLAIEVSSTIDPTTLLACPDLFGSVEQVEEAEDGTDEGGNYYDDHVALWSPGWIETEFFVDQAGTYRAEALVRGTICDGVMARWNLWVDGYAIATGASSEDWTWEGQEVQLTGGAHVVRVSFDNDCYNPDAGEDRNLYVDAFRLTGDTVPVGEPEAFSACMDDWLTTFLPRAWRHPEDDPTDRERLVALYEAAMEQWDGVTAARLVLEVVLQSPRFLYRVEDTVLDAADGETVALDDYEMASRLSYFLWGTMPDDTLFEAAAAGTLTTPDGLEAQARRMLEDPRALEVVELFFAEWMELDRIDNVEKDAAVYPDWTDDRPESFREETLRFVRTVWAEENASFETLLTADWTIANDELARFYGYAPEAPGWARVDRDPAQHAGLLTHGSLMAARARSYGSSPIHRGMFIRGAVLCHTIPAPDASLMIEVPDPDPTATTREVLEQHRADPVCASCHDLIDPPGLAFEHFDGIGRWRSTENGLPVDPSTDLTATDVNGPIDGAAELGQALVRSQMVHECFSRQWFRFAHGRRDADGDECEIEAAAATFSAGALDMQELVLATITSPAFRSAVGSR